MAVRGVTLERRDRILVLTLTHPPSNALTRAVRHEILSAIAVREPDCRAIVIAGSGANFSSLLPLEPDHGSPSLAKVCAAVEGAGVPVVAALHGLTMGPGAELALAATARIGTRGCRFALPEVALGLCSVAGSTRRLPRLIGAAAALRLFLTGRVIGGDEAMDLGLFDLLTDADPLAAALDHAARLADLPARRPDRSGDWQAAIGAARRSNVGALPAVGRIIACVEAGLLLPPDNAMAFEAVARADLETTPEAAGLCAAARAERRAATLPPAVAKAAPMPLSVLGLVGDAPGLTTLARAALSQGIAVRWLYPAPHVLDGVPGLADAAPGLLQRAEGPADLIGLALQVHAGPPQQVAWHPAAEGTALLVLDGAEGEMGLAIAPSGRVSELSVLAEEAPQAIATAVAGLRRLQVPPLLVGHRPGLGREILQAGERALSRLAASGVPTRDLAAALAPFGLALPVGLPGAQTPRQMVASEICNRWLAAMANRAFFLLDQGIARRPSDVDHALVSGHGFARWRGGPMHLADRRGLLVLRHDLRLWADEDPVWTPAPLLDRLIQDGLRLPVLDG